MKIVGIAMFLPGDALGALGALAVSGEVPIPRLAFVLLVIGAVVFVSGWLLVVERAKAADKIKNALPRRQKPWEPDMTRPLPAMRVAAANPLPEPCAVPILLRSDLTGGRIVLIGASGRLWVLEFRSDAEFDVKPTPVSLPDLFPSEPDLLSSRYLEFVQECAGDHLVVGSYKSVHVYSLKTGQTLLSLNHFDKGYGRSVCLTPDRTMLLAIRETRSQSDRTTFTSVYAVPDAGSGSQGRSYTLGEIDQPDNAFRTTLLTVFPRREDPKRKTSEYFLDAPESVLAIPIPNQPGQFHLVIGCDGYLHVSMVAVGSRPEDIRVIGEPRFCWKCSWDPMGVERIVVYPYVFFCQIETYLTAFNLETGATSNSPWMADRKDPFLGFLPGRMGSVLLQSRNGWIRWAPEGQAYRICNSDWVLLREIEGGFWAIHKDDPGRILRLSAE